MCFFRRGVFWLLSIVCLWCLIMGLSSSYREQTPRIWFVVAILWRLGFCLCVFWLLGRLLGVFRSLFSSEEIVRVFFAFFSFST